CRSARARKTSDDVFRQPSADSRRARADRGEVSSQVPCGTIRLCRGAGGIPTTLATTHRLLTRSRTGRTQSFSPRSRGGALSMERAANAVVQSSPVSDSLPSDAVRLVPLGGLGEIGMTCLALEGHDGIVVVDC